MKTCEWYALKREVLGMTQNDVAKIAGVTSNTVGRFERGDELTIPVFNQIKWAIDKTIDTLDPKRRSEVNLEIMTRELKYTTPTERLYKLAKIQRQVSFMLVDEIRENNG